MNEQDKAAFEEWWTTANVRLTDIPKAQAVYIYESMLAHRDKQAAQTEPVAWDVMNGVCFHERCAYENEALELALKMQKNHDLSGSWAYFHVQAVYNRPAPAAAVSEQLREKLREAVAGALGDVYACLGVWVPVAESEKRVEEIVEAVGAAIAAAEAAKGGV